MSEPRHKVKIRVATPEESRAHVAAGGGVSFHPKGTVLMAECDHDTEIANLEWRVVEAALDWRQDLLPGEELARDRGLLAAVDALIEARKKAEKEEN